VTIARAGMTPEPAAQSALSVGTWLRGAVTPQRAQGKRPSQASIRKIKVKLWLKNSTCAGIVGCPKHAAEPF
jgi:hypothetical protein